MATCERLSCDVHCRYEAYKLRFLRPDQDGRVPAACIMHAHEIRSTAPVPCATPFCPVPRTTQLFSPVPASNLLSGTGKNGIFLHVVGTVPSYCTGHRSDEQPSTASLASFILGRLCANSLFAEQAQILCQVLYPSTLYILPVAFFWQDEPALQSDRLLQT